MAIQANKIVSVNPRILSGTGADLVFNGLVFTTNKTLVSGDVTAFSSASAVSDFFGVNSDEYIFANVYFGGFSGSQLKPSALYFYKFAENGAAPFLQGSKVVANTTLANLKQINKGTFTVSINGTTLSLEDQDLTNSTSLSNIADILQDNLRAIGGDDAVTNLTVEFSSVNNTFTITSGTVGEEGSVSFADGSIAEIMHLTKSSGATLSAGENASNTLTNCLNKITQKFQNFVTFTSLFEPTDDQAIEFATWASNNANQGTMYLYVCWDSDPNNLIQSYDETITDKLKALNIGATTVTYGTYKECAFIMGASASVDYSQTNGTITFAFKAQNGLGATINNTTDHDTLLNRGLNFIGNYATRNDQFVFLYNGQMLGEWAWIDAYLNAVWLCNALQVQIMAGFKANRRVSYTESGYSIIRSWCRDVINRGLNNGVIDTGMSLSETQKTNLIQELGGDYSDEITNNGYYLQVVDVSATERQHRESPKCNLIYCYAGSVQKLNLPVVAVV